MSPPSRIYVLSGANPHRPIPIAVPRSSCTTTIRQPVRDAPVAYLEPDGVTTTTLPTEPGAATVAQMFDIAEAYMLNQLGYHPDDSEMYVWSLIKEIIQSVDPDTVKPHVVTSSLSGKCDGDAKPKLMTPFRRSECMRLERYIRMETCGGELHYVYDVGEIIFAVRAFYHYAENEARRRGVINYRGQDNPRGQIPTDGQMRIRLRNGEIVNNLYGNYRRDNHDHNRHDGYRHFHSHHCCCPCDNHCACNPVYDAGWECAEEDVHSDEDDEDDDGDLGLLSQHAAVFDATKHFIAELLHGISSSQLHKSRLANMTGKLGIGTQKVVVRFADQILAAQALLVGWKVVREREKEWARRSNRRRRRQRRRMVWVRNAAPLRHPPRVMVAPRTRIFQDRDGVRRVVMQDRW